MYIIRIGGTSDFVSKIDPDDSRCYPPGSVELVKGWNNPQALRFATLEEAEQAAKQVFEIEGFHNTVEEER
jgi:hypothetical protein